MDETICSQSSRNSNASSLITLTLCTRTVKLRNPLDKSRTFSCMICNGI